MKAIVGITILVVLAGIGLQACKDHTLSAPATDGTDGDSVVLTSFSPSEGVAGTVVRIQGSGFGTDTSLVTVRFGDVEAEVIMLAPTEILVRVPAAVHTSIITVIVDGEGVNASRLFRIPFNAANYRTAIVDVGGIRVTAVEGVETYDSVRQSWASSLSRHYDTTISFTTVIQTCRQGCDSGASAMSLALCCPLDDHGFMGTGISLTVDTLLQRFQSVVFFNRIDLPSDSAAGYYIRRHENLYLKDVPYIEADDGSLVCTLYPEQFNAYIPYGNGPLMVATQVTHIPDWGRSEWLQDRETWTEMHLNAQSPSEAYIRITLK